MRKTSIKSADREKSAASEKQKIKDFLKKQRLEREAFREWLAHKDEFEKWLRNIKNGEYASENATKLLNGALKRPVKQGDVSVSKSFGEAALKIIDDIKADTECALMFSTLLVSRNVKLPDVSLSNDMAGVTVSRSTSAIPTTLLAPPSALPHKLPDASEQPSASDAQSQVPAALQAFVTAAEYQAWQHVQTTMTRVRRASFTPEQAEAERSKSAGYAASYRAGLTQEKAQQVRDKAKVAMRLKRAQKKSPTP